MSDPARQPFAEDELLFTRVFSTLTRRYLDSSNLRRMATLSESDESRIETESINTVARILGQPNFEKLFFSDKQARKLGVPTVKETLGGPSGMGRFIATYQMDAFKQMIDAAAQVFMHSALDAAITDLCRVTAMISPADWAPLVAQQSFKLADYENSSYPELLGGAIRKHLDSLDRESLLVRTEKLRIVCRPDSGDAYVKGYVFDNKELERIDLLRHSIVHNHELPGVISKNIEGTRVVELGRAEVFEVDHTPNTPLRTAETIPPPTMAPSAAASPM